MVNENDRKAPPQPGDQVLLNDLTAALDEAESVPAAYLRTAEALLSWRTVDAEALLAELIFDSACDGELAGALRSGASARTLAFVGSNVRVEIGRTEDGLAGQVIPASGGSVTVESTSGIVERAHLDEIGFFVLGTPPAGPVRLHATTGGHDVLTSWVCLTQAP